MKAPDIRRIIRWIEEEGGCEAVCGCWVEPDGHCEEHDKHSWAIVLGLI